MSLHGLDKISNCAMVKSHFLNHYSTLTYCTNLHLPDPGDKMMKLDGAVMSLKEVRI